MAFGATITVTVNSIAKVLSRINQDGYTSEYRLVEATGIFRLFIRNKSYVKNGVRFERHTFDLYHELLPVAPATTGITRHAYFVLENQFEDGLVEPARFGLGFAGLLTQGNLDSLLQFQS